MKGLKWLPVKGVLQAEGQANYSPYTTVILLVCPSALLCSALWDYTKSYWAQGTAAKISRPELIKTNRQYKRGLSPPTKHQMDQKEW